MSQAEELLTLLKKHVNAVEFDSDDELLQLYIEQSILQILAVCNRSYEEITAMVEGMDYPAARGGFPADFTGAVLELAAAKYRYGEAYSEASLKLTPSFAMVLSKYRKPYIPEDGTEDETEEEQ